MLYSEGKRSEFHWFGNALKNYRNRLHVLSSPVATLRSYLLASESDIMVLSNSVISHTHCLMSTHPLKFAELKYFENVWSQCHNAFPLTKSFDADHVNQIYQ